MKRHLGTVLVASLLGGLSLSGCEAVESIGKSIESMSWGPSKDQQQRGATAATSIKSAGVPMVAELPANCPQIKVLDDLATISQFSNSKTPKAEEMIASASFASLDATCSVAPNSVTLEITLDFDGQVGPVGKKNQSSEANFAYPYFLSVITPGGQILSKDVFALSMIYSDGKDMVHKQDRLRQTIPLMAGQAANQYQIVIGFQLSEDELAYNRTSTK
ncbi:MAG: hypothetical protein RBR86_08960 [Pseudobdellovibrionaceae bacterium]|jgi:hypothetical protein|nr:hypothetical protein [Pseudobdellovibrionaceae bacterium]